MPQSLDALYVHLVFSTKDRVPYLQAPGYLGEMHAYLGGIALNLHCPPICIGGVADHVHLLVRTSRTMRTSDLVRDLKSNSSHWIRERVPNFGWQAGYGAFSVGTAEITMVRRYIETQPDHHREISFQDEFRTILQDHGIEWDERYVWD